MISSNINPQELQTFEAMAEDWWSPDGPFKTLHDINPLRLAFITQQVDLQQKKVIDVGCGGGILTESMVGCGAIVTGIDMSAATLSVARQHAVDAGITVQYLENTVEDMAERYPHQFDVVTCMELLEHVPDPASVVRACTALVAPGGQVFFSTLNRNLKAYFQAILAAEYVFKLLPRGLHHYEQFIRPSELARWARGAGLAVRQITGLTYHPLTKRYQLSQNTDVNYLMQCELL